MNPLAEIRNQIAAQPPVAALAEQCRRLPMAASDNILLRVAPLITAARTPVVAALAAQTGRPLLSVVYTTDMALRAAQDLRQWLPPEAVLIYPASDTLPYEYMSADVQALGQRLQVLQRLAEERKAAAAAPPDQAARTTSPLVIVAPLRALQQPTLTPEELTAATTELRVHDWQAQDTLLRHWVELGYQMVPMVEKPGDMSRRGGIVDIWPATDAQPLRIEWFGDEIDSLRRFDPQSQRSAQPLQAVTVLPPGEVPFWRHAGTLERLQTLDLQGLRPEVRDEWQTALDSLQPGGDFAGWQLFAPFFRQDSIEGQEPGGCSLAGHLPHGTPLLFSEMTMLARAAAEFQEQAEEQRASLIATGELPSAFPRPYLEWDELLSGGSGLLLIDVSNNDDSSAQEAAMLQTEGTEPLFLSAELFGGQLRRLVSDIGERLRAGETVIMVTPQVARIRELVYDALGEQGRAAHASRLLVVHGALDEGWRLPDARLTLYTDTEIFGWRQRRTLAERQQRKERSTAERAAFLRGLKPGDYVVHIEHGIAVYEGLLRRTIDNVEREYLNLRYAKGDRLYVPVDQVDRVTRYVGTGDAGPQLTRLGTQDWERAKRKARAAVRDMADELLAIYARRQASSGHAFSHDTSWQHDLENAFPYIETDDQLRALQDIKQDMEQSQPMDRLMCGDVGFGKTEVALRAAFKAIQDGKQVAVLVPTTVLAQQHYNTFRQRMEAFPVRVEMLSRFRSAREQEAILRSLARGGVDIIIGTHRLLSKDVHFKSLGLLIVDEEQRFGVRHKERLKQVRAEVDVLTLTATPIPRTLHMTLAGIRDMSVISTPPEDRIPIKTYVVPYQDALIRDAIRRELDRGGQVYFLHNRVYSIYHIANHLRALVPEADIGVAHGQLDERQLEKTMLEFFRGEHDVLVCTTIIENGLDVPNANTMIIDDATTYGLAQLYQLRGRVGRSANRAYAYLLYRQDKPMTMDAQQRLEAIQEATELGAGFRIAMRDLEIRGAGNLLGAEQSGHIAAVGFDLYSRLLEQAVSQLKQSRVGTFKQADQHANGQPAAAPAPATPQEESPEPGKKRRRRADGGQAPPGPPTAQDVVVNEKVLVSPLVTLDLPLTAYIPEEYILDEEVRLSVYQRMVEVQSPGEVRILRQELRDRFGELPAPVLHLLTWLHIKALALAADVRSVMTSSDEFVIHLPTLNASHRERITRRFRRDPAIKVGTQFIRLDRRYLNDDWVEKLVGLLEVLGSSQPEPTRNRRAAHS